MPFAALVLAASLQDPMAWEDFVRDVFDPALCLPEPVAAELEVDGDTVLHMPTLMRAWVKKDFALAEGAEAGEGHQPRLLGDLVQELRLPVRDSKGLARRIEGLQAELPGFGARDAEWLSQLLRDEMLWDEDWDPDDDEPDDGLLLAPEWELRNETPGRHRFWRERGGNGYVYQLTTLYFADATAIAETDCDLESYKTHANNEYEDIHAVPGTLVRGVDPQGRPFAYYRVFYTWDIDFPYSTYDCDLHVWIHVDDDGNLVTDTMSNSEDLYWAASRDLFLPVFTSTGEWVCMLMTQQFGVDLDGVPDAKGDRLEGYRGLVGSKKKISEKAFEAWKGAARNPKNAGEGIESFPFPGGKN
jgi:hypothetical protein